MSWRYINAVAWNSVFYSYRMHEKTLSHEEDSFNIWGRFYSCEVGSIDKIQVLAVF